MLAGLASAMLQRRADESAEQRMRLERLGLELGMELAAQIPGMVRQLADLDVNAVGSFAGQPQAVLLQHGLVFAVEFVAMAVALADFAACRKPARAKLFSASRQG